MAPSIQIILPEKPRPALDANAPRLDDSSSDQTDSSAGYQPSGRAYRPRSHPKVPLEDLAKDSEYVHCPSCGHDGRTRSWPKSGVVTHVSAALAGIICLCCVPYFVAAGKDIVHHCSQCGEHLATWRLGCGTVVHQYPRTENAVRVRGGPETNGPKERVDSSQLQYHCQAKFGIPG